MKNIAVALHSGMPAQRNSITNFFAQEKFGYWHWVDDFWIVQVPDGYTPKALHARVEALPEIGTATILVFEFKGPIQFWGRADKEAWNWLSHIGKPG